MSTRSHPRPPGNPLRYEKYSSRNSRDYEKRNSSNRNSREPSENRNPNDYNNFSSQRNSQNSRDYPQQQHQQQQQQQQYYSYNSGQNPQYSNPPPQPSNNAQPYYQQNPNSGNNKNEYSTTSTKLARFRHRPSPDASGKSKESKKRKKSVLRGHFVASVAEFIGTIMFLWFAFAWHQTVVTQTRGPALDGTSSAETVLYISLGYGFSLLVAAWSFYRISGGLFNPAVTFGLVLTGGVPFWRGIWLVPAELLGGICAAALVSCMFPGDIAVTNTTLAPDVSIAQGVFIEMFLTSLLIFTVHMLAAEKTKATFIAPIGIGLALFVAELAGVYYTGGSLNPARSLGPAVVSRSFVGYFWIYVVGPGLGALLAAGYYMFNKWLDYEDANPGQDSSGGEFGRQDSQA